MTPGRTDSDRAERDQSGPERGRNRRDGIDRTDAIGSRVGERPSETTRHRREVDDPSRRRVLRAGVIGGTVIGGGIAVGTGPASANAPTVEWTYEAEQLARTAPTVVDGVVHVGMTEFNSHRLHTIDADTGDVIESVFQRRPVNEVSVVNGLAFVAEGGPGGERLEAYDTADYERVYRTEPEHPPSTQPVVNDGTVYLGSDDGIVYALDAWTAEPEWEFDVDDGIDAPPAVFDGTVYAGCTDERLYAIDAASGDGEWTFEAGGTIRSSPTIENGTVYVGASDDTLYAVDAGTGERSWEFDTNGSVTATATVADGSVYVGDWDGTVHAVDADDGTGLWTFGTGDSVRASATVAEETVFVASDDGRLYALDVDTGDELWAFDTGNPVDISRHQPSPTVVDGTIYFVNGHTVYALDAGVSGSGSGSRMRLGTRGHHETWAETAAAADPPSIEELRSTHGEDRRRGGSDGSSDDDGSDNGGSGDGDDGAGGTEDGTGTAVGADDDAAGPGILGALAGVGGATYLLARRGAEEVDR